MADTAAQGFQDTGARVKAVASGLLWAGMGILRTTLGSPKEAEYWTSLVLQWLGPSAASAGGRGSILGWETKIPDAIEQLSLHTTPGEAERHSERC